MRPKKGQEKGGNTPTTQFRLSPHELAQLDAIAAFHAAEDGKKYNRTAAIRVAIRGEYERITGRGRKDKTAK
jgi:hypothetical protein